MSRTKNRTDQSSTATIQLKAVQCDMLTIAIYEAMTMFETWPCSLDCRDFCTEFMLSAAVGVNRWNLHTEYQCR